MSVVGRNAPAVLLRRLERHAHAAGVERCQPDVGDAALVGDARGRARCDPPSQSPSPCRRVRARTARSPIRVGAVATGQLVLRANRIAAACLPVLDYVIDLQDRSARARERAREHLRATLRHRLFGEAQRDRDPLSASRLRDAIEITASDAPAATSMQLDLRVTRSSGYLRPDVIEAGRAPLIEFDTERAQPPDDARRRVLESRHTPTRLPAASPARTPRERSSPCTPPARQTACERARDTAAPVRRCGAGSTAACLSPCRR